jgi:hypothetical protein
MNRNLIRAILMAPAILLVSGCNLVLKSPAAGLLPADETATKVFVLTAAARTLSALGGGETQSAAAAHPTATPTLPPTATFTPSITLTSTHERVTITVSKNTNCREGPDKFFDLVGVMKVGETAEAVGRNAQKTYWVIRLPSNTAKQCWLWWEWATLTGNGDTLPVIESPPTPTWSPKPDFTFYYLGLTTCGATQIIRLQVVNSGNVPWESYAVHVKDTVTSIDSLVGGDDFRDYSGCTPVSIVPAIAPGETAFAVGVAPAGSGGHNLEVTLHLYTQNSGGGTHMSGNFSFTMP